MKSHLSGPSLYCNYVPKLHPSKDTSECEQNLQDSSTKRKIKIIKVLREATFHFHNVKTGQIVESFSEMADMQVTYLEVFTCLNRVK